jgi:hypothetical protein
VLSSRSYEIEKIPGLRKSQNLEKKVSNKKKKINATQNIAYT